MKGQAIKRIGKVKVAAPGLIECRSLVCRCLGIDLHLISRLYCFCSNDRCYFGRISRLGVSIRFDNKDRSV